jgi:hypothetical protein
MPVQIGALTHSFSDPTGLLSDCHRRIELFLGSLEAVSERLAGPLSDEARSALGFGLALLPGRCPKHTADEEESLSPRLRQLLHPELQLALEKLDALENDHRWATSLHDCVDRLGQKCLSDGWLSKSEATQCVARI